MSSKKDLSFENGLKRLEEIVDRLSSEEVSLDDSFKLYEEGTKLIRHCSRILTEFEGKIKILSGNSDRGFDLEQK